MHGRWPALCLLVLLGAGAPGMGAGKGAAAQPAAVRWQIVLDAALDLRERAALVRGREPRARDPALFAAIAALPLEAQSMLASRLTSTEAALQRLQRADAGLDATLAAVALRTTPSAKAIAFPDPDPLADCAGASGGAAYAMFEAWAISAEILAAAKWACLETVLGSNSALACTVIAIETEALETEFELESFCLGVQGDSTISALLQTQSNVADFVNERADAMQSTRASQVSLDGMQERLDGLLLQLTELRAALVLDDTDTSQRLADLLDRALGLAAQLTTLAARVHDIRFRVQATQSDAEDTQQRIADVQARLAEVAARRVQLRADLTALQQALEAATSSLHAADSAQRDREIAAALGDPGRVILRLRLPAAQGGELERSREVLIRALSAYQALGADVAATHALLISGDAAYNQGRALDAYDAYARAYRLLSDTHTVLSVSILRDSFE